MIDNINDLSFISSIIGNQTYTLFKKYKEQFGDTNSTVKTIEKVILMTPENIHLNSFMYEPILDMSDDHLKDLYRKVQALQTP